MIYDTAVIGTGPAGLSAALTLRIREKSCLWLGSRSMSDKVSKAEKISNYPGLPDISGESLAAAFRAHAAQMRLEITEHMVNSILPVGGHYALMAGSEFYEARTVILTTGVAMQTTLTDETAFVGRGVSYCATCDGGLYRGKTIAVLCNHPRFANEVRYLAGLAGKTYYFPLNHGAELDDARLETVTQRPVAVLGQQRVQALALRGGSELAVDGIFCLRDSVALSALLPSLQTQDGHIVVDREMATNLPGVFAAGDCTGRPYQYAKAVGEGNVAAHAVLEYLVKR